MALSHIVGYPRIGTRRELKRATESYWDGEVTREALDETARTPRLEAWTRMRDAGVDLIPSTFSFYDRVLDVTAMVDAVPPRFRAGVAGAAGASDDADDGDVDLDTYFAMARGASVLVPNSVECYELAGAGVVYRAGVPKS